MVTESTRNFDILNALENSNKYVLYFKFSIQIDVNPEPEFIDVLWRLKRYLFNGKDILSKVVFWLFINSLAVFPEIQLGTHGQER